MWLVRLSCRRREQSVKPSIPASAHHSRSHRESFDRDGESFFAVLASITKMPARGRPEGTLEDRRRLPRRGLPALTHPPVSAAVPAALRPRARHGARRDQPPLPTQGFHGVRNTPVARILTVNRVPAPGCSGTRSCVMQVDKLFHQRKTDPGALAGRGKGGLPEAFEEPPMLRFRIPIPESATVSSHSVGSGRFWRDARETSMVPPLGVNFTEFAKQMVRIVSTFSASPIDGSLRNADLEAELDVPDLRKRSRMKQPARFTRVTRSHRGDSEHHHARVDLVTLVKRAVASYESAAQVRNIELRLQVAFRRLPSIVMRKRSTRSDKSACKLCEVPHRVGGTMMFLCVLSRIVPEPTECELTGGRFGDRDLGI